MWPVPCPPVPPPPACLEAGRLCYANRTATGYNFVILPERGDRFRFRGEDTWSVAAERVARGLYARLRLRDLRGPATVIEATRGIERVAGLQRHTARSCACAP